MMTDSQEERPATLRRTPRPAADEAVDPVDSRPPAVSPPGVAAPATLPAAGAQQLPDSPAPPRRRGREVTVPFSTRLSPEIIELVDQAAAETGYTIRAVVEEALRHRWSGDCRGRAQS